MGMWRFGLVVSVVVLAAAPAGAFPAHVIRVIDGDTFWAWIEPMPDLRVKRAVRIAGIDAPELNGKCAAERELAIRARDRLRELLNGAVTVEDTRPGKYAQRLIARVLVDGRDVAPRLLAEGLARVMSNARRVAWCLAGRRSDARPAQFRPPAAIRPPRHSGSPAGNQRHAVLAEIIREQPRKPGRATYSTRQASSNSSRGPRGNSADGSP